jgi:hypothetical protein
MKITEMIISTSLKFQTVPYSNQDIFMSVKSALDENEDPVKVAAELRSFLQKAVLEEKAAWDDINPDFYDKPACLR